MRIIANDVILSKGSQGSNPCLSVQKPAVFCGLFLLAVCEMQIPADLKFQIGNWHCLLGGPGSGMTLARVVG